MAARQPAPTSAKPGDGKVNAIGAIAALVLAGIGGTAFLIQPGTQHPVTPTTQQAFPPATEPAVALPPTIRQTTPTPPATTPNAEKNDKSTKPKPPPRDPG